MLYTQLTQKAMDLAYNAHHGQRDKAGVPYIFHPLHLAEQMGDDEYAICTALLHDVVEDTPLTFEDLENAGFPEEVISALRRLTHRDGEEYLGPYIQRIKGNPLARRVKLADLRHNSDVTRLPPAKNESNRKKRESRMVKYAKAMQIHGSD